MVRSLWASIRPWLANPEAEIQELEASTRPVLARYFLPGAAIWFLFSVYWAATGSWAENFKDPLLSTVLTIWFGCIFLTYFVGAGVSFGIGGTWSLVRLLSSRLDFRPGLILEGGKTALAPFNQLFIMNWLFFVWVIMLSTVGSTPVTTQGLRNVDIAMWLVIGALSSTLVLAQRSMTALLLREKQIEVRRLRNELTEVQRLSANPDSVEVLLSMHRSQMLMHDLQRAEAFNPSLLDTRFVIQISLSVTAILIANVLLRTVLEGVL
jgi:hypothetical protein